MKLPAIFKRIGQGLQRATAKGRVITFTFDEAPGQQRSATITESALGSRSWTIAVKQTETKRAPGIYSVSTGRACMVGESTHDVLAYFHRYLPPQDYARLHGFMTGPVQPGQARLIMAVK